MTVLSRIVLALGLILGALFLLPTIGASQRGKQGNARFLPLLIAALFIAALFLKYLIAIVLLLVIAGMLIVAVLRATGVRLFGNRKVSLWLVAAVLVGMYYGFLFLVRWAAF